METLIRHCILSHLISVCTVKGCPTKRMLGLYELTYGVHAWLSDRQIHTLFVLALLRVNNVCKSGQYPYQAFLFLFGLIKSQSIFFSVMLAWAFLGCTRTKQRIMSCSRTQPSASCEAQPETPRSQVKHSTTEPPLSSSSLFYRNIKILN